MEPDDLMPNDGTWLGGVPIEPKEQLIERKKERAKALESKKVIEEILGHFQERIDYRGLLESIKVDITKDAALHQKICEVNDLLKMALEEEKQLLEELLEIHG